MEGMLFFIRIFHRRFYEKGSHVFIMHVQWVMMNALYGRLLIVRLLATANVAWTLLAVMFTEIFLRATMKERDFLLKKMLPRLQTTSTHEETRRLRSDIIALGMKNSLMQIHIYKVVIYRNYSYRIVPIESFLSNWSHEIY